MAPEKTVGPTSVLQFAGIDRFCMPNGAPTRRQTSKLSCNVTKFPGPALHLPERNPVTDRLIEFYMPRSCLESGFSALHDGSY